MLASWLTTVKKKFWVPAGTVGGIKDDKVGDGLEVALTTNSADPEFPPPGAGFVALTGAEPAVAMSDAPT